MDRVWQQSDGWTYRQERSGGFRGRERSSRWWNGPSGSPRGLALLSYLHFIICCHCLSLLHDSPRETVYISWDVEDRDHYMASLAKYCLREQAAEIPTPNDLQTHRPMTRQQTWTWYLSPTRSPKRCPPLIMIHEIYLSAPSSYSPKYQWEREPDSACEMDTYSREENIRV